MPQQKAVEDREPTSALLEAVLSNTTDALWVITADGRVSHFNRIFGYHCKEFLGVTPTVGASLLELIPHRPRLRAYWADLYARALSERAVISDGSLRVFGTNRFFTISSTPVLSGRSVEGAVFALRDVTEYRRHANHEFFRLMLGRLFAEDASLDLILCHVLEAFCVSVGWDVGIAWLVNADGTHLEPSAVWHRPTLDAAGFHSDLQLTHFTKGHGLPGRAWSVGEAIWFEDLNEETAVSRTAAAREMGLRGTLLFPIRDSREIIGVWEFLTVEPRRRDAALTNALNDLGGEIGRYMERYRIDEDRLKLQENLERKGAEWSTTFDAIDAPIIVLDVGGRIIRLNRAARDLSEVSEYSEVLGLSLNDIGTASHWRILNEVYQAVRDSHTSVAFQLFDDVSRRYWDISADLAEGSGDDKVIVVMRDITRLIELQESVRRGEQLSAMGELVAGVAHEVRNPLFGIAATIETMEMTLGEVDADTNLLFDALRQWVRRLSALMEQLLEYGKAWSVNLQEGEVDEVIQQAIDISQGAAEKRGVTIEFLRSDSAVPILLDPARLLQVFQNLIINAVQHSPAGERVTVSSDVTSNRQLECAIRDRGPGFVEKDLTRMFQPFFTTRRGGTGLGLSIVQRIVDEHGGTIDARNHPDGGAFFIVRFPTTRKVLT